MTLIRKRRVWELPGSSITKEELAFDRRAAMKLLGASAAAVLTGCYRTVEGVPSVAITGPCLDVPSGNPWGERMDASRNEAYSVPERAITEEQQAKRYNNFYEYSTSKEGVCRLVHGLPIAPWTIRVSGLVQNPGDYGLDDLLARMPLEERLYRLRCVEAWAMTIPWVGFPLSDFIRLVEPLSNAKYVRFVAANEPIVMPGVQASPQLPWAYHEALRLDEALNELAFLATGMYGRPLPVQNGAPIRLVVPWKYGYKSIKAITELELLEELPSTFWPTASSEYEFFGNVNPEVPHPRWSQANETIIGPNEVVPTQLFNGYAELVAHLYV
jgi:methionine sulfoxide reductase catalytic subunit